MASAQKTYNIHSFPGHESGIYNCLDHKAFFEAFIIVFVYNVEYWQSLIVTLRGMTFID